MSASFRDRLPSLRTSETTTETVETIDEPIDDVLKALSNARRRHIVWHIGRGVPDGDRVTIRELAEHVAAIESGPDYTSEEYKTVYVAMYQAHMTKLEAVGAVIEVRDGVYRAGENIDALCALLEAIETHTGEVLEARRGDSA